jgi:hypothetical protein
VVFDLESRATSAALRLPFLEPWWSIGIGLLLADRNFDLETPISAQGAFAWLG